RQRSGRPSDGAGSPPGSARPAPATTVAGEEADQLGGSVRSEGVGVGTERASAGPGVPALEHGPMLQLRVPAGVLVDDPAERLAAGRLSAGGRGPQRPEPPDRPERLGHEASG